MNRNLGAEGHDIRRCEGCGELFCAKCSDNTKFCSSLCESDARVESHNQELVIAADARDRARDMNAHQ